VKDLINWKWKTDKEKKKQEDIKMDREGSHTISRFSSLIFLLSTTVDLLTMESLFVCYFKFFVY
jgi:hypothetical protein